MPVRGGFESNELLNYINFELIDFSEKFFFGFSDTSVLLNAMSLKMPKSRFIHGPNLITFAQIGKRDITFDRFVMALNGQYDISPINFYANYTDNGNNKLIANTEKDLLQKVKLSIAPIAQKTTPMLFSPLGNGVIASNAQ